MYVYTSVDLSIKWTVVGSGSDRYHDSIATWKRSVPYRSSSMIK